MDAPTVNIAAPLEARRIGELLVSRGVVTEDQVRIALTEQKRKRDHLGRILVRLGFATEAVIRDVLGGALGYDSVDLGKVVFDSDVVQLIPKDVARRYHLLALTFDQEINVFHDFGGQISEIFGNFFHACFRTSLFHVFS